MVILNKLVVVVAPFAKKLENLMFSDVVELDNLPPSAPVGVVAL